MEQSKIVDIYRNYLDKETCDFLSNWCLSNKDQFVKGISKNNNGEVEFVDFRHTNRMSTYINYHEKFYEIQEKIAKEFNFSQFGKVEDHGKDGIVISITYDGGDVYEHIDPSVGEGFHALRFNILLSEPISGGTIYVKDEPFDLKTGDAMCYLVSKHKHRVEKCYGNPRIMIMYGWRVPASYKE